MTVTALPVFYTSYTPLPLAGTWWMLYQDGVKVRQGLALRRCNAVREATRAQNALFEDALLRRLLDEAVRGGTSEAALRVAQRHFRHFPLKDEG